MESIREARKLIDIPDDLFTAVGKVSVRHGQIEHVFAMTFHRVEDITYTEAFAKVDQLRDRDSIRKAAKHSFRKWAREKLGAEVGGKCADDFDELISMWPGLYSRRDDVIHCCWSTGVDDNQLTGTRKGDLLRNSSHPMGVTDVEHLAEELTEFVFRLNEATKTEAFPGDIKPIVSTTPLGARGIIAPLGLETSSTAASIPSSPKTDTDE